MAVFLSIIIKKLKCGNQTAIYLNENSMNLDPKLQKPASEEQGECSNLNKVTLEGKRCKQYLKTGLNQIQFCYLGVQPFKILETEVC